MTGHVDEQPAAVREEGADGGPCEVGGRRSAGAGGSSGAQAVDMHTYRTPDRRLGPADVVAPAVTAARCAV
ncbi:hypothetical protein [Streptomyces massasporeus]|uniref:hypothetical protein n=1 Tax=Streptomyces massasporeus TaxID=67324 RepID=UPI003808D9EB